MIDKINNIIIKFYTDNGAHNYLSIFVNVCILIIFIICQHLSIGSFEILDSLAWFTFMFIVYGIGITYMRDREFNYIVMFGLLNTFNNLLDETIYQNLKLTYAELMVSILITIILVLVYVKRRNISKYRRTSN